MKLFENQNLKEYNTFGMEVYARQFLAMESADETPEVIGHFLREKPYYILGGGSNTLFTKDFDGTIVHPAFTGITIMERNEENVLLRVAAGEPWENLIQYCIRRELYGIENLTAIPGLAGSAPVQNIGASSRSSGTPGAWGTAQTVAACCPPRPRPSPSAACSTSPRRA